MTQYQWHGWVNMTLKRLVEVLPSSDYDKREVWTTYLPHVIHIIALAEFYGAEGRMWLLNQTRHSEQALGRYKATEWAYQQLVEKTERLLKKNHVNPLTSISNLAEALQGYERVLSPAHPLTLQIVNYLDQGRLTEAEHMYEWALQGKDEASTYKNQGWWKEAEEMKMMETADMKLQTIEQTIREVSISNQESALLFDLPRELVDFLQQELRQDCDLGLVPTITGTPIKAYAATVRDYINFAWPLAEFDVLELLTKAQRNHGLASKIVFRKVSHGVCCPGDSINLITDCD